MKNYYLIFLSIFCIVYLIGCTGTSGVKELKDLDILLISNEPLASSSDDNLPDFIHKILKPTDCPDFTYTQMVTVKRLDLPKDSVTIIEIPKEAGNTVKNSFGLYDSQNLADDYDDMELKSGDYLTKKGTVVNNYLEEASAYINRSNSNPTILYFSTKNNATDRSSGKTIYGNIDSLRNVIMEIACSQSINKIVIVTNPLPSGGSSTNDIIVPSSGDSEGNPPPTLTPKTAFSTNVSYPKEGDVVRFTNNSLPKEQFTTFDWNFGDGTPNTKGNTVTHIFTNAGTYKVTLTTNMGQTQTTIKVLKKKDEYKPAVASCVVSRESDGSVRLRSTSNPSNQGPIISYYWEVDGRIENSLNNQPSSSFVLDPGTHRIRLSVDGSNNWSSFQTITIPEREKPKETTIEKPTFSYDVINSQEGKVQLKSASIGPITWMVDGKKIPESGANISLNLPVGKHRISLCVEGTDNCSPEKMVEIIGTSICSFSGRTSSGKIDINACEQGSFSDRSVSFTVSPNKKMRLQNFIVYASENGKVKITFSSAKKTSTLSTNVNNGRSQIELEYFLEKNFGCMESGTTYTITLKPEGAVKLRNNLSAGCASRASYSNSQCSLKCGDQSYISELQYTFEP